MGEVEAHTAAGNDISGEVAWEALPREVQEAHFLTGDWTYEGASGKWVGDIHWGPIETYKGKFAAYNGGWFEIKAMDVNAETWSGAWGVGGAGKLPEATPGADFMGCHGLVTGKI